MVYCYSAKSKRLSMEAMFGAYQKSDTYHEFSWDPSVCLLDKKSGRWDVYYNNESIVECQNKCYEIFKCPEKLRSIGLLIDGIINKADWLANEVRSWEGVLKDDYCLKYFNVLSELLNYYMFTNEFCFMKIENEIINQLREYLNEAEIKDVLLINKSIESTYSYRAYNDLSTLRREFVKTGAVQADLLDQYIEEYAFLFNQAQQKSPLDYVREAIESGRQLFAHRDITVESSGAIDASLKKCAPMNATNIENISEIRLKRLQMRESMMRLNFMFARQLSYTLNHFYGSKLSSKEKENLMDNLAFDDLFEIDKIDVYNVLNAQVNTIIYTCGSIYYASRQINYKAARQNGNQKGIDEVSGDVVYGTGLIQGVVKTCYYNDEIQGEPDRYIYVTKSLHPKDLLLSNRFLAVLVDESGILSHASIIAREMRIPCVMNTKTLSLSLQDGDEVSIDFDNGIVYMTSVKRRESEKWENSLVELSRSVTDVGRYGSKCINLCTCIDVHNVIAGYIIEMDYVNQLYKWIKSGRDYILPQKHESIIRSMFPAILRSSGNCEDQREFTGSGLLESVPNVNTMEEFFNAVIVMHDSMMTQSLNNYRNMYGLDNPPKMAIILQKYYDFFALGTVLIEPDGITVEYKSQTDLENKIVKISNGLNTHHVAETIKDSVVFLLVPDLLRISQRMERALVEFGIQDEQAYILQIKEIKGDISVYN